MKKMNNAMRVRLLAALFTVSQAGMILGACGPSATTHVDAPTRTQELQKIVGDPIWSSQGGGREIRWTTTDLYSNSNGRVEPIWSPLVEKGFQDFVSVVTNGPPRQGTQPEACSYERVFRLLSVVGSLISFEDEYSDDCGGAHPSADIRYTTIDLSKPGELSYARKGETPMMDTDLAKPGKIVTLTDYFSEPDILRAILADSVIRKELLSLNRTSVNTLAELPELFAANDYGLEVADFELRPDFLTRFAFHHVEGDKAAVRLDLPAHSGANRGQHLQLGLLLTIPESLQQQFALAAARQQGFLMKDAGQVSGNRTTTFRLKTGK